nr:LOW QUALITY PROTEIN: hypothetical protein L204_00891 [Cryptococcus depauperatus CBS 7855]
MARMCTLPPIANVTGLIQFERNRTYDLLACYYTLAAIRPLLFSWTNTNAGGIIKASLVVSLYLPQCSPSSVQAVLSVLKAKPSLSFLVTADLFPMYFKRVYPYDHTGLFAGLKGMPTMSSVEADAYKFELIQKVKADGMDKENMYENVFDGLTNFEPFESVYKV